MKKTEIILGVTGSIASYKACDIVNLLRAEGFDVTPVLTKEALEFITPLSLETLASRKAFWDMFELPEERSVLHMSLAERAGLILIAPATANIIGKLASGVCDDLLTCVVMASKAPVLIAPAMNTNMYKHAVVQENIAKLRKIGYKFVGPVEGRLACGGSGLGHLAPVKEIVAQAKRLAR
jgi:phosphopantothenoylcysteine decarboxylase/phosphopantothenate--cysteine ligase